MITADMRTLTPDEFARTAAATFERLNTPNPAGVIPAEVITVDGEPRAVLLSPATFEELVREANLTEDVECMRRSFQQIEAGEYYTVDEMSREIRAKLLAVKKAQQAVGAGT